MTTALLYAALWYVSGVAGTIIYAKVHNMDRRDIRTGLMILPLFGPIILLMGVASALGAAISAVWLQFFE